MVSHIHFEIGVTIFCLFFYKYVHHCHTNSKNVVSIFYHVKAMAMEKKTCQISKGSVNKQMSTDQLSGLTEERDVALAHSMHNSGKHPGTQGVNDSRKCIVSADYWILNDSCKC